MLDIWNCPKMDDLKNDKNLVFEYKDDLIKIKYYDSFVIGYEDVNREYLEEVRCKDSVDNKTDIIQYLFDNYHIIITIDGDHDCDVVDDYILECAGVSDDESSDYRWHGALKEMLGWGYDSNEWADNLLMETQESYDKCKKILDEHYAKEEQEEDDNNPFYISLDTEDDNN